MEEGEERGGKEGEMKGGVGGREREGERKERGDRERRIKRDTVLWGSCLWKMEQDLACVVYSRLILQISCCIFCE